MSEQTADVSGGETTSQAIAGAIPTPGPAPVPVGHDLPAPEAISADVEAMLLSAGRAVSGTKLAVALGLIAPPIEAAGEQGAASASSPVPATDPDPAATPTPTPAPSRKRGRKGPGPADAESVISKSIELLNTQYERTGRSFRIEQIAGGYRFMTLARHAGAVAALHQDRESIKLSRQAIETLAIIAYRQPITRAELEAIRGVACGEVLRSLMERRLAAIVGRSEELGRPMLYGTSKHFLDAFGLASLKDLPSAAELKTAL